MRDYAPAQLSGDSLLWGLIKTNILRLDVCHHCTVAVGYEHKHTQPCGLRKGTHKPALMHTHGFFVYSCYIFLWLHSDYLLISCSDCASGPWWGPRGSVSEKKSGRERDSIFLDRVFDQCDSAQTKVIALPNEGTRA